MTNTQAELREKIAAKIAPHMRMTTFNPDCETQERNRQYALEVADAILALLPPAPAVGELTDDMLREAALEPSRYQTLYEAINCIASDGDLMEAHEAREIACEALAKVKAAVGEAVPLKECPPGLFLWNGNLCFRSEYATMTETNPRQPDAYVVESGEYFWGGVSDSRSRDELMVQPVTMGELPK